MPHLLHVEKKSHLQTLNSKYYTMSSNKSNGSILDALISILMLKQIY